MLASSCGGMQQTIPDGSFPSSFFIKIASVPSTSISSGCGARVAFTTMRRIIERTSATASRSRPVVLRRAVVNVADNALKYGKAARMSVNSTGSTVQIIIDDDGPGIPLALQEEAFRPFRRLDDVANGEIDGTGLGLSVARSIVRSLGGQIALQNRERGGLRVILTLPA